MQKKTSKRSKGSPKVAELPAAPAKPEASVVQSGAPSPDVLLREAEEEPNYRSLASYCPVIDKLRSKGFSYREIAEWLTERGVEADHNAIYRVYINSLSDQEAAIVDKEDEEEAMVDAHRNR